MTTTHAMIIPISRPRGLCENWVADSLSADRASDGAMDWRLPEHVGGVTDASEEKKAIGVKP